MFPDDFFPDDMFTDEYFPRDGSLPPVGDGGGLLLLGVE
jgi:hypothetical protein